MSLRSVAAKLPFTYTGADFYALCSDAMLKAVTRQASGVDAKVRAINAERDTKHQVSTAYYFDHYATAEDIAVMVTEADFLAANDELIPSVSAGELAHYEKVRATFEGVRDKRAKAGAAMPQETRPASAGSVNARNRPGSRGQGKTSGVNKGKGKAVAANSDDEYGADEDHGGQSRSKGKGKAPIGFQDGRASDDDGLY